jgi:hypothetical protein
MLRFRKSRLPISVHGRAPQHTAALSGDVLPTPITGSNANAPPPNKTNLDIHTVTPHGQPAWDLQVPEDLKRQPR